MDLISSIAPIAMMWQRHLKDNQWEVLFTFSSLPKSYNTLDRKRKNRPKLVEVDVAALPRRSKSTPGLDMLLVVPKKGFNYFDCHKYCNDCRPSYFMVSHLFSSQRIIGCGWLLMTDSAEESKQEQHAGSAFARGNCRPLQERGCNHPNFGLNSSIDKHCILDI